MDRIFTHDLMAYDGLKILQKEGSFRFSLDSLLLGDFVTIKPSAKKLMELGCGSGAVLLYLSLKTKIKLMGVDIQKDSVELALESIKLNGLESQISVFNQDIKTVHNDFLPNSVDIVVSNPPFFKVNDLKMTNPNLKLSLSRHEIGINFKEILLATKKILKTNGSFFFIHRASRLEEIIGDLQSENFVIKTIRFVYTKHGKDALMVLIEARLNGKIGNLKVLEPLYVYEINGDYSEEILRIFHLGDKNYVTKS